MDPNANLKEQREIRARLRDDFASPVLTNVDVSQSHDVQRLVELSDALDQWLTSRGTLPAPWSGAW